MNVYLNVRINYAAMVSRRPTLLFHLQHSAAPFHPDSWDMLLGRQQTASPHKNLRTVVTRGKRAGKNCRLSFIGRR